MNYDFAAGGPNRIPALDEACRAGGLQKAVDVLDSLDHSYEPRDLEGSLFLAFACGQLDIARYLLDRGATVGGIVASTAIHSKAGWDLVQVLEMLLEHGWDVNEDIGMACTALWWVISLRCRICINPGFTHPGCFSI